MKSIHNIFTDEEFKEIEENKKNSGLTWHDFIIKLNEIKKWKK